MAPFVQTARTGYATEEVLFISAHLLTEITLKSLALSMPPPQKKSEIARVTTSILKHDPNTKRFKRTLTYYGTDTQYANFWGNPLSFEPLRVWIHQRHS